MEEMTNEYFGYIPSLGRIFYFEIFDYYDSPILFTARNASGHFYLVHQTYSSRSVIEWVFAPVSTAQIARLKNNLIEVRSLFAEPDDNFLFIVTFSEAKFFSKQVSPADLPEDYPLPYGGVFLDLPSTGLMEVLAPAEVEAVSENRDIIDFSLLPNNQHDYEIDAEILTAAIEEYQDLVHIVNYKGKSKSITPQLTSRQKAQSTLVAAGTFAASFGIRLKSKQSADLLGVTGVSDSLHKVNQLLSIADPSEENENVLQSFSPTVLRKVKSFIENLDDLGIGISLSSASADRVITGVQLTREDIKRRRVFYQRIENSGEWIEDYYGMLIAINTNSRTFAFYAEDKEDSSRKRLLEGKLSENLYDCVFPVPTKANVSIKIVEQVNPRTKVLSYQYFMMSFQAIEELTIPLE